MKKNKYIFSLLLFANIALSQVSDTFVTTIMDYTSAQKNTYTIIKSKKKCSYVSQEGAPQLPVFSRNYVLPQGCSVTNITVNNGSKILMGSTFKIFPAQPDCPPNGSPCPVFVVPDPAIYNSSSSFPSATARIASASNSFGYNIVTIEFCPFQYIPIENTLYLYNEINISIQYSVGQINYSARISERRDLLTKDYVRSKVQNPELITSGTKTATQIINDVTSTDKLLLQWKPSNYVTAIPEYIIITSNGLKSTFETLAEYKTKKGIPTLVTTVEQIYENYSGFDNAEKVRNYLKAARELWGDGLFVLLGGDIDVVPGRMAYKIRPIGGAQEWDYTDLYFCDVFKPGEPNYNWNSNGDANFWDEGSTLDGGADNYIGRAPIHNLEEAQNFISKIIDYENPNYIDRSYYKNMLFLGSYYNYDRVTHTPVLNDLGQEWQSTVSNQPFLANPELKKWKLFDDYQGFPHGFPGDDELNKSNALGCLNNGKLGIGKFHLVSHYDHGFPFGIGVSSRMKLDNLSKDDIDHLTNGRYYQIVYSTSCESGKFDKDCFAEHYVNIPFGGAVAMIANSGSTGTDSQAQAVSLFKSIYDDTTSPTDYIMGIAFCKAKEAMTSINARKLLNLFGDPTMATWSKEPLPISLNVQSTFTISNGSNNVLPVSLTNAIQKDALVTLYKFNSVTHSIEVYATQTINAGDTTAQFMLNPDTEGSLTITVTAKNYYPANAYVNILLPEAHLYITSYTISDSNGNGFIEQGETISLNINLTNSGNASISGVNTVLSCLPAFASITNNQVVYPQTINPGQTIQLSGFSFIAQVEQEGSPLPNFIEFLLNITANDNYVHLDNFYLDLKNPQLYLGARNVSIDATDPTITNLNIFINNVGNISATDLTATLTSSIASSSIEILQPISSYPDCDPLTEQYNNTPFKFRVSQSYSGSKSFILKLENTLRTYLFPFDLNDALPPLISNFRFISTQDQITLQWDALTGIKGYNVYKSSNLDGLYTKQNGSLITGTASFTDINVNNTTMSIYYYKISAVTSSGNELPLPDVHTNDALPIRQGYKAWTLLSSESGFPLAAGTSSDDIAFSSPTLYDIDNDGTKEIVVNYGDISENSGKIMCYHYNGQEMFDIDGNSNTISGFAVTDISMTRNSAIGDLDNDGHPEVLSVGRDDSDNRGKLYVYKTIDADGDNKPDKFWNDEFIDVHWRINTNPVLYDVDGNGFLDIIIVDEKQTVYVYDKNKNLLPGWPQQITRLPDHTTIDYSEGHIAVADLDHDGKAEIAIGLLSSGNGNKGAIYIWHHDGTPFTVNPFHEFADYERADGAMVFADIDNDLNLELLITTRKSNNTSYLGKIYAFKQDGTPVNAQWNGVNTMYVAQSDFITMPNIAVGDLNHDGSLEIGFGSHTSLSLLNKDGNSFSSSFPKLPRDMYGVNSLDSFSTPIFADIDDDADAEIIFNAEGKLFAYNIDGTTCLGFPIESESGLPFMSSPAIDDINNDGKNEVVISTKDLTTYVFNTNGHSINNEWASFRGNPHNTGTYREVCDNVLDLFIKDKANDIGAEPNTTTEYFWESDDIWVRNNNDNSLEHQNPEFTGNGGANYIKVRVTNKSCIASSGNEHLTVNWAKAGTNFTWFIPWNGGVIYPGSGASMGDIVGTLNIPPLQPGEETVVTFPWQAPNPNLYGNNGDQWHFCLLAKIEASTDPTNIANPDDIVSIVSDNNNVAWKNVTIVDILPNNTVEPGGVIAVGNPFENPRTFYLEMSINDLETGKPIYEEAEVGIKMDDVLYHAWERGGKEAQQLDPTLESKRKIVKGNHVILDNLAFNGKEVGTLRLNFNFLVKELTDKRNFVYHVMQKDANTGQTFGGETFVINKNPRAPFYADAGEDKDVDINDPVTITATDINEPAIYNWYDSEGNLIFQGKELQIANAVAEKYKLEVISTVDGFKDYSEVEVKLNPNRFSTFAPNPAVDHINLAYKLNQPTSAYIMIVSYYLTGNISNNYVLNPTSNNITVDLSSYPTGFYKAILVVNGQISDAKILIKQ